MTVPPALAPAHLRVDASTVVVVPAEHASLALTLVVASASAARAAGLLHRRYVRLRGALSRCDALVSGMHVLAAHGADEDGRYLASAQLSVEVADVCGLASVHRALACVPGLHLAAPSWSLPSGHPVFALAWRDAVRAARAKADVLADAAGVAVDGLDWVHAGPARCHRDNAEQSGTVAGEVLTVPAVLGVLVEPAPLRVTVAVTCQYRVSARP